MHANHAQRFRNPRDLMYLTTTVNDYENRKPAPTTSSANNNKENRRRKRAHVQINVRRLEDGVKIEKLKSPLRTGRHKCQLYFTCAFCRV